MAGIRLSPPAHQVRARFDADPITVYQAYGAQIADAALAAGTFVPPFSRSRMTWIKPSFRWMMYRSGWAEKPGQERVLAVRMRRSGFGELLRSACLTHFDPQLYADEATWRAELARTPVRIQWDPERTVSGAPLDHRSLQVGIGGPFVSRYVEEWLVDLADITGSLPAIRNGTAPLPDERPYPLPADIAARIGADLGR